ncbi:HNH endonuclease [Pseudomonas sp. R-28-1W-6]|uniref:HNH endonuclease n=1 Tax=Pseudomonas sp. R-28-1W-6 TaxID=2650101 RepID=UPI001365C2A4|nr:HNH endonuclease signature motif containing protein [Pseudomonas sp. R-28-1W-6]MWV13733.1 HNH endonuclease [Pseudomonas sp. R-28-1W-6]
MSSSFPSEEELQDAKARLAAAIGSGRSERWCLALWSRFIRLRDGGCCLSCGSGEQVQAHHVFRKTIYPAGRFELGNGVALCRKCHWLLHAEFNGKPMADEPLNARGGDNQDEMAFLYGLLADKADERGLDHDEFYFISDEMLHFFNRWQGYDEFVERSCRSQLKKAHEIWRNMPQQWYRQLADEMGRILLMADLLRERGQ